MIRGDLDRAASYQRRAASLAREVGNDTWLAIALTNLAQTSFYKGAASRATVTEPRPSGSGFPKTLNTQPRTSPSAGAANRFIMTL